MSKALVVAGAVVVGLGLSAVGAAAWSGRVVVDKLSEQSHALSKVLPTFKVVKEEKQSSLFHSSYDVTLQLGCLPDFAPGRPGAGGALTPIELTFHHDITHGPLADGALRAAVIDSALITPSAWQAQLAKLIGQQKLLSVHTAVDLSGGYEATFKLPSLKFVDPSQGGVELQPIVGKARGKSQSKAGTIPYASEIAHIELSSQAMGQQFSFKMDGLTSSGELHYDPGSIYLLASGKGKGGVASMTLDGTLPSLDGSPGKPLHVQVKDVAFDSDSTLDKGLWSTTSGMRAKAKVNDTSIDKLELKISMKRIQAVAYQRMLQSMVGNLLSCDPNVRAKAPAAMVEATANQASQLLKHDPEYAIDNLAIELGGKRAELSYSVGSKGVTDADLAQGPDAITQKAVVRGAAKVHIGLIDQAVSAVLDAVPHDAAAGGAADPLSAAASMVPSLEGIHGAIDQFVMLGFLTREGDYVSITAGMEQGQVTVNGKPFSLPLFGLGTGP